MNMAMHADVVARRDSVLLRRMQCSEKKSPGLSDEAETFKRCYVHALLIFYGMVA